MKRVIINALYALRLTFHFFSARSTFLKSPLLFTGTYYIKVKNNYKDILESNTSAEKTMTYDMKKHIAQAKLADFCRRNHIRKLSLFGSMLRGEVPADSDIDLLVEFDEAHTPGFLALCHMENELSDMLGRKVDLRTPQELSRYFRDSVLQTAEVQYES